MKCRKIGKLIDGYINKELNSKEREQLSDHINTCANCERELLIAEILRGNMQNFYYPESKPDWQLVRSKLEIKSGRGKIDLSERIGKVFTLSQQFIPVLSAVSAIIIFSVLFIILLKGMSKAGYITNEMDSYVIKEIEAVEVVCQKEFQNLKAVARNEIAYNYPDLVKILETEEKLVQKNIDLGKAILKKNPYSIEGRRLIFTGYRAKRKMYMEIIKIS
jgi:hypothetical protein